MINKILKIIMISLSLSSISFANFNDEVNQYKAYEKTLLKSQKTQIKAIETNQLATHNYHQFDQLIHRGQRQLTNLVTPKGNTRSADGAILFVSFSMPKPLISQMIDQAYRYHIPVIVRGLIDNQMPKTFQAVLDVKSYSMKHQRKFSGIGIDPVWFEQFSIDAVPALVVTKRPKNCLLQKICPNQPFDVVYGNQSIQDSLKEIAANGSPIPKKIAKHLLGDTHD